MGAFRSDGMRETAMAAKESDKDGGQTVDLKWSLDLPDRVSDDLTIGPARRVDIAGRCANCWGQCLAIVDGGDRYVGLACRVCSQNVDEANVEREQKRMEAEARYNLPGARVGRGAEYDETARFVLKILPDMDRNREKFSQRIEEARGKAQMDPRRKEKLTRLDFEEPGTPGHLFLQASALVSGFSSLPPEISAISPSDFDFENLPSNIEFPAVDSPGQLKMKGSVPIKESANERMIDRMGMAMTAGFGAAFACEVGMKAILLTRLDEAEKSHDLSVLYMSLPEDCRERLQGDFPGILDIMKKYRHTFGRWRYFEPGAGQAAVSVLVNLEQIRGLQKAARIIVDEGVIAGLQYDINVQYKYDWGFTVSVNDDLTSSTVPDTDSGSTKISMEIGGHESAIPWDDILSLSLAHQRRSSERE